MKTPSAKQIAALERQVKLAEAELLVLEKLAKKAEMAERRIRIKLLTQISGKRRQRHVEPHHNVMDTPPVLIVKRKPRKRNVT